jgi:hypothetical protein
VTGKKIVMIGCGAAAALVLVVALFAGVIAGVVFYSIGHSEAATAAETFLRNSEKLKQDIGEVQDFGSIISGHINASNGDGLATLGIKAIGAKRSVNTTVNLTYKEGRPWRVTGALYEDADGHRVELLDPYGLKP